VRIPKAEAKEVTDIFRTYRLSVLRSGLQTTVVGGLAAAAAFGIAR
jgi:hypothetical protein